MRCPYCRHEFEIEGRFCTRCGRQVFSLPTTPPSPAPAPPATDAPPRRPASEHPLPRSAAGELIGKTCPYDQYPIGHDDRVIVCPLCKVPHHYECWLENDGCTTYGCAMAPASKANRPGQYPPVGRPALVAPREAPREAPRQPPSVAIPTGIPSWREVASIEREAVGATLAQMDSTASTALSYALLGLCCCPVVSVVALFMGISVLVSLRRFRVPSPTVSVKAVSAVVLGLLGPVAQVILYLALSARLAPLLSSLQ